MTQHFTPSSGLQQIANIISKERGVLQEYASRPTANQKYIDNRDNLLKSLAGVYNQLYSELTATTDLLHADKWLLAEWQIRQLQDGATLDGFHIRLTLGNGNRYGFIGL